MHEAGGVHAAPAPASTLADEALRAAQQRRQTIGARRDGFVWPKAWLPLKRRSAAEQPGWLRLAKSLAPYEAPKCSRAAGWVRLAKTLASSAVATAIKDADRQNKSARRPGGPRAQFDLN